MPAQELEHQHGKQRAGQVSERCPGGRPTARANRYCMPSSSSAIRPATATGPACDAALQHHPGQSGKAAEGHQVRAACPTGGFGMTASMPGREPSSSIAVRQRQQQQQAQPARALRMGAARGRGRISQRLEHAGSERGPGAGTAGQRATAPPDGSSAPRSLPGPTCSPGQQPNHLGPGQQPQSRPEHGVDDVLGPLSQRG